VASAVICAACGAKVRDDRARCLRCGEPLVARAKAKAEKAVWQTRNRWVTIGIAAGCLAFSGFSIMLLGRAPNSAVKAPARAAVPSARAAVQPAEEPIDSPRNRPDPIVASASDVLAGEKAYESGSMEAALQRFQAAVAANPRDARALNDLGQMLVRMNRAQEALQYFDQAVQAEPGSWAYQFNRARAYAQLQQWGRAIDGYRVAAGLFPDDYATQYNLAKALQANGDTNGAIATFEKAIQLAPGQSDFQKSYGLALEAAKRPQDAAAAYRRYLELEPQAADAEKVKAHLAELQPVAAAPAPAGS
jgi:tetratricopeptide (TPR) repeat protein